MPTTHPPRLPIPPRAWLLLGAALLAVEPARWLIHSWTDPLYGSAGLPVFLLCAGLFIASLASPGNASGEPPRLAIVLLGATALIRLAGSVLAVNTVGALALVVDVYALGLWAGLHRRRWAISPGWLALLFAFSLPLERVLQRLLGFPLQQLSAAGACGGLRALFGDGVQCQGVRIMLAGQDVLVDLPCSGSRTLLLLAILFTALAARRRPGPGRAVVGVIVTLVAAWLANSLRIAILAVGIAFPGLVGIDVMAQPWHDLIGTGTLILGVVPIWWWQRRLPPTATRSAAAVTADQPPTPSAVPNGLPGLALIALALALPWLPAQPVDVARAAEAPVLPATLGDLPAVPRPLDEREQVYFTRYGGAANRHLYGELGLTVVETAAPLRHLHAPDECLSGLGHRVEYLGLRHHPVPTALYRSTAPDGRVWRVAVSFVSARGETATSVAEAVWRWWQQPTSWRQIQRVTPWQTPPERLDWLEQAVQRALDLPTAAMAS